MVICRCCGLVYLNPRPDEESLAGYYSEKYPPFLLGKGLVGLARGILRRREARKIGEWLPRNARILEIGCALGDLLVPLRDCGFDVTGIDISPYASSLARERHGLRVHTGTVFDAPVEEGSLDAIIMRGVLEHLPSPKKALQKAASLLRNEGHLFIETPNFDCLDRRVFGEFWHGLQIPRHLNIFTIKTLPKLLAIVGFEIREVQYRVVANDWILSSKYLLEERLGRRSWLAFFSLRNPFLHLFFLPITILQRCSTTSGRMGVVAVKVMP